MKAIIAMSIFVACLAPLGCSGMLDDQCLRRPESAECQ